MVSEKKIQSVKDLVSKVEKYPVIGILNMHKLPGKQLHAIKEKMKGKAQIKMAKKKLVLKVLKDSKKKGVIDLEKYLKEQPAFLFTNTNPFELAKTLTASKSKAAAKPGDIAPIDIMVSAGPTTLPPGPAISELQKAGIPAGVEGGKVAVKKDTVIVKAGETIKKEVADVLLKLNIEPMEIGVDLLGVCDNGTIYDKTILFIPTEKYLEDLKTGFGYGLSLSVKINYYTKDNIKIFLSKAHGESYSLAVKAGYLTKDTIGPILARAKAEAQAIQKHIKV